MNKKVLTSRISLLLGIGLLAIVSSCKKDDPKPVAEFTYEVSDLTVAFTNATTDADTYAWDFGDGASSTEKSPSHTYADYGTYTVTLDAKGAGGDNSISYDVDVPEVQPIVIDGNFTDWDNVADLYSYPDGEGGNLIQAKAIDSKSFLYLYIKGTASIGNVLQVYIDADNDGATGWGYWNWFTTPGIEYLMEAVIVPWDGATAGSVLKTATGPDANWPWEDFIATNAIYAQSEYVTVGGDKVIELTLLKDMFTKPALGNQIRFVFCNSDSNWSNVGSIPPKETEAVPVVYTMKR